MHDIEKQPKVIVEFRVQLVHADVVPFASDNLMYDKKHWPRGKRSQKIKIYQ